MKKLFLLLLPLFFLNDFTSLGQLNLKLCKSFNQATPLPMMDTTLNGCNTWKIIATHNTVVSILSPTYSATLCLNDTNSLFQNYQIRQTNTGNIYSFKLAAGDSLFIVLRGLDSLTLSFFEDLGNQGNTSDYAIELFNGETSISTGSETAKWCKYVFPDAGSISVLANSTYIFAYSTKPAFENNNLWDNRNYVEPALLTLGSSFGTNSNSVVQLNGKKGDVVYLKLFDHYNTSPLWKISLNFRKAKTIAGCDKTLPFTLSLGENSYPLFNVMENTAFSFFKVVNSSKSAIKYKLELTNPNVSKWVIINHKEVWIARKANQPFIFNVPANSTYVFAIRNQIESDADKKINVKLSLAQNTDPLSDYDQNIKSFSMGSTVKTDVKSEPNISYRFVAPKNGLLKVEHFNKSIISSAFYFYKDSNEIVSVSSEINNSVRLKKGEITYFSIVNDYYVADTLSWKANFIADTEFVSLSFRYLNPTGGQSEADYTIDSAKNIKVELPYGYNISDHPVTCTYNTISDVVVSLDNGGAKSFTLTSNDVVTLTSPYGETKTYSIRFTNLPSLRMENQILSCTFTNQIGSTTIDSSKKIISATIRYNQYETSYEGRVTLSRGAYIKNSVFNDYSDVQVNVTFYDTLSNLTVFSETGDSTIYTVYLKIDSTGALCDNTIFAHSGVNTGDWLMSPTYFEYIPENNAAVRISSINPSGSYIAIYDSSCDYYITGDYISGNESLVFKGIKGNAYRIIMNDPVSSFTITEEPYSSEKDILSISIQALVIDGSNSSKYYFDKPNHTIWLKAPYSLSLIISKGASMHCFNASVENDYVYLSSLPDTLQITAMDGSTSIWYFRQIPVINKTPKFLSFALPFQLAPSQIDTLNHVITCFLPDTTLTSIRVIPSFVTEDNMQVYFDSTDNEIQSGITPITLNFNGDSAVKIFDIVQYVNDSTIPYPWKVIARKASATDLIAFNLDGQVNIPFIDYNTNTVSALLYPYVDKTKTPTYFITSPVNSAVSINGNTVSSGGIVDYSNTSSLKVSNGAEVKTFKLSINQVPKACQTSFTYAINDDIVTFTANPADENFIYQWDFGDNTTSILSYFASHIYKPGLYTVTLSMYDPQSECLDTRTQKIEIGNVTGCKAAFTYTIDAATKQVSFVNSSKGSVFYWTFDDGTFSTDKNPTKTYTQAGIYKVSLLATNTGKTCKDISTSTIIFGDTCDASFSYLIDTTNNKIKLYANYDNPNVYHYWTTGDAKSLTSATPELYLDKKAIYSITHTIIDKSNNCTDKYTRSLDFGKAYDDVEANFTTIGDNTSSISFINLSKGNIVKYLWNFGDNNLSSNINPVHTYNTKGIYNVCLTVTGKTGVSNTGCKRVLSNPLATDNCMSDFTYFILPVHSGLFIDRSTGSPTTYRWDFGDNNTSTLKNASNKYVNAGYYLVQHSISNNEGCSDRIYRYINVDMPEGLKCIFVANQKELATKAGGYPVDFIGAGVGDDVRIKWTFGDGSTDTTTTSPTHVYANPGSYDVCYTITDPITEQEDTYCQKVNVYGDAIKELANKGIWSIYPVPFDNYLNIQINNPVNGKVSIELFDVSGRSVAILSNQNMSAGWNSIHYDASNLKSGTYLLKYTHANGSETSVIIKK
jgi:PKD repeat protein